MFAPTFRYFDAFDAIPGLDGMASSPRIAAWGEALAARPSVRDAVAADYPERLWRFLLARGTWISRAMDPGVSP